MEPLPPSIGIIGGMGPWVDALLLLKILEYQTALGMRRDQDAIPTLLAQFSPIIEDRTQYLVSLESGEPLENPAVNVARIARMLAANGARVLGIPCNTFHAGPIFCRFEQELRDLTSGQDAIHIVHMIQATIRDLFAQRPGLRQVGILSSNGTYLHHIYSAPVSAKGLEAITLPYDRRPLPEAECEARKTAIIENRLTPSQNDVHRAICHPEWGIKAGKESQLGYPTAKAILKAAARRLQELGAETVILGCTEIPIALQQPDLPDLPLHDPLDSLARALVDAYRSMQGSTPVWLPATELPSR